jgi:cbb3-type cytochrome oxidase subunit 3
MTIHSAVCLVVAVMMTVTAIIRLGAGSFWWAAFSGFGAICWWWLYLSERKTQR